MKLKNNISGRATFFINDSCNYQCSYCITSLKAKSAGLRVNNCKFLIQQIKKNVPRGWHFLISGGGEPFLHPYFFYIVSNLVRSGYLISINTNFSSPINDLKKFLKITKGRLVYLIASLHLEFSNPDIFIDKITALKKSFPNFSNYCVVSVALPKKLDYLEETHLKFKKSGIKFELQQLRLEDDKCFKYSKKQQKRINEVNLELEKNKKNKTASGHKWKKCLCGHKYFILSPFGESFRCIPAMKNGKSKNGNLGNILEDNFSLHHKPEVCLEKSCFCLEKYNI